MQKIIRHGTKEKKHIIRFDCKCGCIMESNEWIILKNPKRVGRGDIREPRAYERCMTCKSELKIKL